MHKACIELHFGPKLLNDVICTHHDMHPFVNVAMQFVSRNPIVKTTFHVFAFVASGTNGSFNCYIFCCNLISGFCDFINRYETLMLDTFV